MDGASAAGKFFILRSSFLIRKGKYKGSFPAGQIKTAAGSENVLTKQMNCVNKNNALIYRVKSDVFARGKYCFSTDGMMFSFVCALYEVV